MFGLPAAVGFGAGMLGIVERLPNDLNDRMLVQVKLVAAAGLKGERLIAPAKHGLANRIPRRSTPMPIEWHFNNDVHGMGIIDIDKLDVQIAILLRLDLHDA